MIWDFAIFLSANVTITGFPVFSFANLGNCPGDLLGNLRLELQETSFPGLQDGRCLCSGTKAVLSGDPGRHCLAKSRKKKAPLLLCYGDVAWASNWSVTLSPFQPLALLAARW